MKKDMQSRYLELQMLSQQIQQIQKQIEMVETQMAELDVIGQSIDDFTKVKLGTEILVPLTNGVFAKAELKDNKNLIVNVGAGTAVNKPAEDTKKMVDKQTSELMNVREEMLGQLQQYVAKARALQEEVENLGAE